jgi:hypothetical protein
MSAIVSAHAIVPRTTGRLVRHPYTAAFFLFAALAAAHTWPLVTDPGTLSRNDNATPS